MTSGSQRSHRRRWTAVSPIVAVLVATALLLAIDLPRSAGAHDTKQLDERADAAAAGARASDDASSRGAAGTTAPAAAATEHGRSVVSGDGGGREVGRAAATADDEDVPIFTHRSAAIEDVSRRPVGLRIGALDVVAPVAAAGRDGEGQLDVPENGYTVVWYRAGSVPGAAGSAVLAAHVDYNGHPGVFFDLDDLREGDLVLVDFDDGTTLSFEVIGGRRYSKERLPVDQLFTRDGDAVLTLITCGGQFNSTTRHYDSNTVVQATLR